MSDTPLTPDSQAPDAISFEALRNALGKGFPEATALQPIHFGDSNKHEGIHDLVILLTLIFRQESGGPSIIQTIHALGYLSELLEEQIKAADAIQRRAIEKVIEEESGSNPLRAFAARTVLGVIAEDMSRTFDQVAQIRAAADGMRNDATHAQMTVEAMNARGADTPRPRPRDRCVSDQLLDSIGIDREAFESYFDRRTAG
jgi:hypothetical protein